MSRRFGCPAVPCSFAFNSFFFFFVSLYLYALSSLYFRWFSVVKMLKYTCRTLKFDNSSLILSYMRATAEFAPCATFFSLASDPLRLLSLVEQRHFYILFQSSTWIMFMIASSTLSPSMPTSFHLLEHNSNCKTNNSNFNWKFLIKNLFSRNLNRRQWETERQGDQIILPLMSSVRQQNEMRNKFSD